MFVARKLAWLSGLVGTLALAGAAQAAIITPSADANAIANAISAQAGLVTGASFATGPSGASAAGISGPAGVFFPTDQANFGVLTTGDVANADPPNNAPNKGTSNAQSSPAPRDVRDLTILKVDVNVPAGTNCIGVDFAFYSEEFPEFVGTSFNDGFLAEVDTSDWTYDSGTRIVTAPNNFAQDTNGKEITVNTALASNTDTLLQYDGSTVLLRARRAVTPGPHSLFFSIFDAGDNIFDSAVFLDNLRATNTPPEKCVSGAQRADTDGDGLPDEWETAGVDVNGDGAIDLDLPAMGANPNHKDIFLEIDAMPNHQLNQAGINTVIASFAGAAVINPDGVPGITLHVDNGPASPMKPDGTPWGALSAANAVTHQNVLGSFAAGGAYNWAGFDAIKAANFSPNRVPVFHYVISAHLYGAATNTSSGISRGIGGSDLIVSLAAFCPAPGHCSGTVAQQAGTLMHELGHNLGLRHGGGDNTNRKPNYLSIMNYAFQMSGLVVGGAGGRFDYSRFSPAGTAGATDTLPQLNEAGLDEGVGLGAVGPTVATYSTVHHCPTAWVAAPVTGAVDWDCNGTAAGFVAAVNINGDTDPATGAQVIGTLDTFNDWANIRYKGGAIGGFGLSSTLPLETEQIEPPATVIQETASLLAGDTSAPTVKIKKAKKPKKKVKKITVTVTYRDDKGLDTAFLMVGKKLTTIPGKGKKAITKKVVAKKGTKIVASALDKAGNSSKPARLKVK